MKKSELVFKFCVGFFFLLGGPNSFAESIIREQSGEIVISEGNHELIDFLYDFAKISKKNIMIDPSNRMDRKKIYLSGGSLEKTQLDDFVSSLLMSNKLAWRYNRETKLYTFMSVRNAKHRALPVIQKEADLPFSNELVVFLYRPKYFLVKSVERSIRLLLSRDGYIGKEEDSNTMMIVESAANVRKVLSAIKKMDTAEILNMQKQNHQSKIQLLQNELKAKANLLEAKNENESVFYILFSAIGLMIGFMMRGYLIRRIEGGF